MTTTQFPLRQKRKAESRGSLIRSAQRLFADQGYNETTLEQIAEHAGLHVQTLYRHFANKQELATAGDQDLLASFRLAIRAADRSDTTFEFWRAWVGVTVGKITQADGGRQFRKFLIQRWTPAMVSSKLIQIGHEYEDLLAESLAKDFDETDKTLDSPRLAAITLWGTHSHLQRLLATRPEFDLVSESMTALDSIEALFGHLIKR